MTLWISDSGDILRDSYELLVDEADKLRGSHGREDFQLIDGIPLPDRTSFYLNAPNGNTGDFEKTFSRYRKFRVSTRILPTTSSEK